MDFEVAQSLIDRVWNYAQDIVEGEILACKKHVAACQRFLDDIEKSESEDYPYYFDYEELYYFYEWSRLFKHKEGVLAGQIVELNDWQLFVSANIFAWKKKSNGARRYKYAYIQVARKNAKSFLQSLIASYTAFLSDEKQQIYIAGVKKDQSKIVYEQIMGQITGCKALKGKFTTSYGKITVLKNDSVIRPLSKDDGKKGDGLFPSLAIIDELHLHETSEIYDVMKSGMIGRRNALIVAITTAGLDLNTFGHQEYQYASKIIDPENKAIENDEYFVMICELEKEDDIKDEKNWIKANPIVATIEELMDDLRSRVLQALQVPEKMVEFLTKHMNRWIQARSDTYMDLAKWNACGVDVLPDLTGREALIGVDLSSTIDLTSVGIEVPLSETEFVTFGHSFMPEERLYEKMKTDKVPYDLWARQGWLTLTPGDVVDYKFVEKYIDDTVEKLQLQVQGIFYDEWNAQDFANRMMDKGYILVKVIQGMRTLAPATKSFRDFVYQKRIVHDNNPVIGWAMGNAITKVDHNLNFMLDKSKSTHRIDPVACLMNAHTQARFHFGEDVLNNDLNRQLDFLDSY
jgi:phage terminase large subunit-like protein